MPSIHSIVSTSCVVRSQSTAGTRKSASSRDIFGEFAGGRGLEPEIHLHAHRACERIDDLDGLEAPQPRQRGVRRNGRRKYMSDRSRAKRRSTPGRSTLTATACSPSRVAHAGAMHLRDRSRRHRFAEFAENGIDRFAPKAASTVRDASSRGKRGHAVLQQLRDRAQPSVRRYPARVARNWPSLT